MKQGKGKHFSEYIIFLDTNAITDLLLYFQHVDGRIIDLDEDCKVAIKKVKKHLTDNKLQISDPAYDAISHGCKFYKEIIERRKSLDDENTLRIYYSMFNDIEARSVLLKARLLLEFEKVYIPERIAVKSRLGTSLQVGYADKIGKKLEEELKIISELFSEKNIKVEKHEDPQIRPGILTLTLEVVSVIQKYVIMEPFDLYIYASAICARSNEILTTDRDFRETVHNIISGEPGWAPVKSKLENDIKAILNYGTGPNNRTPLVLPDALG